MRNEVIVALAWLIGQLTATAVAIYFAQKNIEGIGYFKAAHIYLSKEIGLKIIAFCGLLTMLFLFPDFWDANINRMDLKLQPVKTWKENIMIYQRSTAYVVALLIDVILILGFKKGHKAVQNFAEKLKIG